VKYGVKTYYKFTPRPDVPDRLGAALIRIQHFARLHDPPYLFLAIPFAVITLVVTTHFQGGEPLWKNGWRFCPECRVVVRGLPCIARSSGTHKSSRRSSSGNDMTVVKNP
jgi:hypothetical protein